MKITLELSDIEIDEVLYSARQMRAVLRDRPDSTAAIGIRLVLRAQDAIERLQRDGGVNVAGMAGPAVG